jgi:prepilin-type N-terminal cleavage/methylation domain-containing protein
MTSPTALRPAFSTPDGFPTRRALVSETGFSLIELLIVVAIIGIIAAIAIPNLLASRRAANEASAISAIRTISSAEAGYRAINNGGNVYATLNQLVAAEMLDNSLAAATTVPNARSGYMYGVLLTGGGTGFVAGAAPVTVNTGTRSFSSDEPGVIYFHTATAATVPTSTAGGTALSN